MRAKSIVFATGALERPLVFSNNDRPGVMLASAVRTYLNRFAVAPLKRAVIVTNNDTAYLTAFDLADAGIAVTMADHRKVIPSDLLSRAAMLGMAMFPGTGIADVEGAKQVSRVQLAGAHSASIECDVLAMSGGWSPAVHLTSHGGIKPAYDEKIAAFVPGGFAPTHFGAGAVMGRFGTQAAIKDGNEMGAKAVADLGKTREASALRPKARTAPITFCPCGCRPRRQGQGLCRCAIRRHREGYQNRPSGRLCQRRASEALHHARHGHRPGQDLQHQRDCHHGGLARHADHAGRNHDLPPALYGPCRWAPLPAAPSAIISGLTACRPCMMRNKANGATFIEAGLWMRAWYYAWAGNSPETAYIKEMELVRKGVGLADVSTLGKIDVQGPDAAEFLNRVYVNGFAKLPVGKARYGVMLNDDGVVLDDGTTTRISDTQFYLTTTTAQAGEVMSWLEYLLQVHWTDLKVHVTSLTDEWAGMAVSGPKSREALQLAFPDADVSTGNLPYMGCLEVNLDGVPIRLLRLSLFRRAGL